MSTEWNKLPPSPNAKAYKIDNFKDEKELICASLKKRIEMLKVNLNYYLYNSYKYFTMFDKEPLCEYIDLVLYYLVLNNKKESSECNILGSWLNRLSCNKAPPARIGELIYILYKLKHFNLDTFKFMDSDDEISEEYINSMYC